MLILKISFKSSLKSMKCRTRTLNQLLGSLLLLLFLQSVTVSHVQAQSINAQSLPSQITRLEPSNWWVGFKDPSFQIMVYGKDIAEYNVSIPSVELNLHEVSTTSNSNYLFLDVSTTTEAVPGTVNIEFEHVGDAKESFSVSYPLLEREANSSNREGFNTQDVIYLITPDRFVNGDQSNDSHPEYVDSFNREDPYGRHGGDIEGIIQRLDYIKDMGFTALWLNPVLENAMDESSYHGYATTDYYKTDPRYGSNELYQTLSKEAKKRGIKLIMDQIMNHSGSNHWWMTDPPSPNWVHYQTEATVGDYQVTNHRRTTLTDPYASEYDTKLFTDGWFVPVMPDLNQGHPLLADYLITNSLWWIEYAGLAGIRHDTHPYVSKEFLTEWTCRVMDEYPSFNIVGEEWGVNPLITAKWQRGGVVPKDFESCLPSLMDFPMQVTLVDALTKKENWDAGWIELYELVSLDYLYPDPMNLVVLPDNHDMERFIQQVGGDLDLFKMGLTYVLTTRGIPQIYYGTEIAMESLPPHGHGEFRRDFPGGWPGDEVNAFEGRGLNAVEAEIQDFSRKLLNWRKDADVVHHGKMMHFAPKHDGVYVFFRFNENESIMVVLNKNESAVSLDMEQMQERLQGYSSGIDVVTGEEYSLDASMKAPPRQALILRLE
mgnify:CR=1 FL=1